MSGYTFEKLAGDYEQALHDLRFNPGMGVWYHAVAMCIEEQDKRIKAMTSALRQKLNRGELKTVKSLLNETDYK